MQDSKPPIGRLEMFAGVLCAAVGVLVLAALMVAGLIGVSALVGDVRSLWAS